jgi:hypothetical protein
MDGKIVAVFGILAFIGVVISGLSLVGFFSGN